jgi:hypothetical protein
LKRIVNTLSSAHAVRRDIAATTANVAVVAAVKMPTTALSFALLLLKLAVLSCRDAG